MGITYVIFGLLCGVSLAAVVWGLARRGRIYEYPFWAGVVFLLWACPQLYGICAANNVPGEMIDRVLIMACLLYTSLNFQWCGCFGAQLSLLQVRGVQQRLRQERLS